MLYDRPYMRHTPEPATKQTSAVTMLLIVTIAIFVLQQVLNVSFPGAGNRENHFLTEWFAFSSENFKSLKVWTVISYSLLHSTSSIMHILGNMFGLFFIGRMIEPLLGKQQFLILYFTGAIVGALSYLIFHFNDYGAVVGASAAVFALISFFCMRFPERSITLLLFFIIPITVKPKWLFWGLLSYSIYALLFNELPGGLRVVAHSAHLGGFLVGVLYFRYIYNGQRASFMNTPERPTIEMPEWFKRRKKTADQTSYHVNRSTSNRDELQREVDRILDKINTSGFGSLSDLEKATLDRAKDILNK
jgi:membrane associated rhomboid family serine protease